MLMSPGPGAKGCKLVNISPLRSDMAAHLVVDWIAPRPNTDTALILALAYEIFRTGRADRAFLTRYTNGAEAFETYVMGAQDGTQKTPDWAAQLCDIPAQVIRDLADRISRTKTMIAMAWGMQRADRGDRREQGIAVVGAAAAIELAVADHRGPGIQAI